MLAMLLGELDGVERNRLAGDQHDVAQVQIAMTAPHGAGRGTARHQVDERHERPRHRRGQRLGRRRVEPVALLAHLTYVGSHRMAIVLGPGRSR